MKLIIAFCILFGALALALDEKIKPFGVVFKDEQIWEAQKKLQNRSKFLKKWQEFKTTQSYTYKDHFGKNIGYINSRAETHKSEWKNRTLSPDSYDNNISLVKSYCEVLADIFQQKISTAQRTNITKAFNDIYDLLVDMTAAKPNAPNRTPILDSVLDRKKR